MGSKPSIGPKIKVGFRFKPGGIVCYFVDLNLKLNTEFGFERRFF